MCHCQSIALLSSWSAVWGSSRIYLRLFILITNNQIVLKFCWFAMGIFTCFQLSAFGKGAPNLNPPSITWRCQRGFVWVYVYGYNVCNKHDVWCARYAMMLCIFFVQFWRSILRHVEDWRLERLVMEFQIHNSSTSMISMKKLQDWILLLFSCLQWIWWEMAHGWKIAK